MCIIVVSAESCGNSHHDLMAEYEFGNRGNHLGRVDDTTIESGDVDGINYMYGCPSYCTVKLLRPAAVWDAPSTSRSDSIRLGRCYMHGVPSGGVKSCILSEGATHGVSCMRRHRVLHVVRHLLRRSQTMHVIF
jgi:hypothetical protein